jgi:transposase
MPTDVQRLGQTLKQRTADVVTLVERRGISKGATEVINERLKLLSGSSLGFRTLPTCIARSLLAAGDLRLSLHP